MYDLPIKGGTVVDRTGASRIADCGFEPSPEPASGGPMYDPGREFTVGPQSAIPNLGGRPLDWRDIARRMEELARAGADVYGVARCTAPSMAFNLIETTAWDIYAKWRGVVVQPLDEKIRRFRSPEAIIGISDAGAHNHPQTGAEYTTHFLGHWVRDQNLVPLEEAVKKPTAAPARRIGICDRGTLRQGMAADLTLFDLDALKAYRPEMTPDFPAGESRLVQRAEGYRDLIVNGPVAREGNDYTGARGEHALRRGR